MSSIFPLRSLRLCGSKTCGDKFLMKKSIRILISGRVQGVFFRYSARQRAEELGLTGYAKNLYDGRVEIIAAGDERRLKSFLAWARQGPPGAHVEGVEVKWLPIKNSFPSFTIR